MINAPAVPSHPSHLAPDLDEARRFLQLLDPTTDQFTFQTFDDRKGRGDQSLVRVLHGTLDQRASEITRLNQRGAGIFVVINKTDGKGRKAQNITGVRAVWHEDDVGAPLEFHCRPSLVVESSPGKRHRYWLAEGLTAEEHRGVMEHMDVVYGSDCNAKDLSRVLRLPGYFHMKGDPFQVRILEVNGTRYPRDELLLAFQPFPVNAYTAKPDRSSAGPSFPLSPTGDPLRDPFALAALRDEATLLADTSPGGGTHGGRNHALNVAATKLGGFVPHRLSRDEVEAALFDACVENGLVGDGEDSVWATMASGLNYGMTKPRWEGMSTSPAEDFAGVDVPNADSRTAGETGDRVTRFVRHGDVAPEPPKWLVRNVLPATACVAFIAGQSQAGKTFIELDLATCLATGTPFFDRAVHERVGSIVLAAEGADTMAERLEAVRLGKLGKSSLDPKLDTKRLPIFWLAGIPNLLSPQGVVDMISALHEGSQAMQLDYGVRLGAVFIDTMAAAFAFEDENASSQASRAIQNMRRMAEALGVVVLPVHHYGKNDEAGMRGSSALRAGADVIIAVTKDEKTGQRELILSKSRRSAECQSAPNIDPRSASKVDPLTAWAFRF